MIDEVLYAVVMIGVGVALTLAVLALAGAFG